MVEVTVSLVVRDSSVPSTVSLLYFTLLYSVAERGIKGAGGLRSEVKGERERHHCAEKRPIVREESPDIRQVHPTAPCPSLDYS